MPFCRGVSDRSDRASSRGVERNDENRSCRPRTTNAFIVPCSCSAGKAVSVAQHGRAFRKRIQAGEALKNARRWVKRRSRAKAHVFIGPGRHGVEAVPFPNYSNPAVRWEAAPFQSRQHRLAWREATAGLRPRTAEGGCPHMGTDKLIADG
jgi:hypothetical protein